MAQINEIASLVIVIVTALTGILAFIEKCGAIKWKPLSKIFNNKELNNKIDTLVARQDDFLTKLNTIEDENDLREIKRLRAYILDYANQKCDQGIKMTQEQEAYFDECCTDYEQLIDKHHLTNGHIVQSIQRVSDYRKMELKEIYAHNVQN